MPYIIGLLQEEQAQLRQQKALYDKSSGEKFSRLAKSPKIINEININLEIIEKALKAIERYDKLLFEIAD